MNNSGVSQVAYLNELHLSVTGTAQGTDVTALHVYHTRTWSGGATTTQFVGTCTLANPSLTGLTTLLGTSLLNTIDVIVDFSPAAVAGRTLRISVQAVGIVTNGHTIVGADVDGGLLTIGSNGPASVLVHPQPTGGSGDYVGDIDPAGELLTYTLHNTGGQTLDVHFGPTLLAAGQSIGSFSVVLQPAAQVAPGGSTTFSFMVTPISTGSVTFRFRIAVSDPVAPNWVRTVTVQRWVAGGPAPRLVVVGQPQDGNTNQPLGPIEVRAWSESDHLIDTYNQPISVSIKSGPAGGTLAGQTTLTPVVGILTFGLSCTKAGTYVLEFSGSGLRSGESQPIVVSGGGGASGGGGPGGGCATGVAASPLALGLLLLFRRKRERR
ncbi:MAG: hypothetical protein KF696_14300 [Planctomycetes bacterium]|nr:hypothetical protein [Planctomycetota bacterium]MCW8136834.1 hypothetical protein [Planctomycetota bacterium]